MPQNSIYYAVGRLSVLGQNALDGARLERLMQAPTAAEARRALSEMGWKEEEDYARMAESHVEEACKTLRKLATDERILDCFLLRYDVNNLKMLIKARCLGVEAQTLSSCGVYALDRLRHDVAEHRYADLAPELQTALNELEKRLAVAVDPLDVDVSLDKALYETIFAWLPEKARAERRYFTARVDIVNLTIALRVLRMGKDAAFFSQLLLPCGSVGKGAWLKAFAQPEKLPLLVNKYGAKVYGAAIAAQMDPSRIAQLERAMDDYLLGVYSPYRRDLERPERLVGYLLMREREASAVRLILAGKLAGFPNEKIRERLRELYA